MKADDQNRGRDHRESGDDGGDLNPGWSTAPASGAFNCNNDMTIACGHGRPPVRLSCSTALVT